MKFWRKIKKNKDILEKSKVDRDAFTEQFLSEVISCGGCQKNFSLGDHALKISCSSCNLFFHCHIAGACVGPNCSVILDGKKESLKYCMSLYTCLYYSCKSVYYHTFVASRAGVMPINCLCW